jgi:hypothetical protein
LENNSLFQNLLSWNSLFKRKLFSNKQTRLNSLLVKEKQKFLLSTRAVQEKRKHFESFVTKNERENERVDRVFLKGFSIQEEGK